MKKIVLIIPAYNEAGNIEKVISGLKGEYDYIIANDGSIDDTVKICRERNYNILDIPINLGLAGAFQTALQYAYEKGYDYAIQFDGDGQHRSEYINGMMKFAEEEKYNIVIGSRFIAEKKPLNPRMIGSRLISALIKIVTGIKIQDSTSGMRLFDRSVMKRMAYEANMAPEPDTIAYLIKCGAKVGEYPVEMGGREFGESYLNFANSIKYMWRICFSILLLHAVRERKEL